MPSRRRVLGRAATALSTAALAATAGCAVSAPDSGDRVVTPPADGLDFRESVRAVGDPIAAEDAVRESASDYDYLPASNRVRYPAITQGPEVVEYGYVSFPEWAFRETATIAASAVSDFLDRAYDWRRLGWVDADGQSPEGRVNVQHVTLVYENASEVIYRTPVDPWEYAQTVPGRVEATVHFAGKTATHTHPVYVFKARTNCSDWTGCPDLSGWEGAVNGGTAGG